MDRSTIIKKPNPDKSHDIGGNGKWQHKHPFVDFPSWKITKRNHPCQRSTKRKSSKPNSCDQKKRLSVTFARVVSRRWRQISGAGLTKDRKMTNSGATTSTAISQGKICVIVKLLFISGAIHQHHRIALQLSRLGNINHIRSENSPSLHFSTWAYLRVCRILLIPISKKILCLSRT